MTSRCSSQMNRAMTLLEAVVVIFVIAFLVLMLLPPLVSKRKVEWINCSNNLKQVLIAYRVWEEDNNRDQYPMDISVTNGGSQRLMSGADAWKTYQVMSNELSTPKILFCPQDAVHGSYATNFGDDLRGKISYFIGLDARETLPRSFLSGDDNFLVNGSPATSGTIELTSNTAAAWDSNRHVQVEKHMWLTRKGPSYGNIGLCDGSVQEPNNSSLRNWLGQTGLATNRLAIP